MPPIVTGDDKHPYEITSDLNFFKFPKISPDERARINEILAIKDYDPEETIVYGQCHVANLSARMLVTDTKWLSDDVLNYVQHYHCILLPTNENAHKVSLFNCFFIDKIFRTSYHKNDFDQDAFIVRWSEKVLHKKKPSSFDALIFYSNTSSCHWLTCAIFPKEK